MPHDHRIMIRLTPAQVKALRAVMQECLRFAGSTHMHGLSQADIRVAEDAMQSIPLIAPANTYIDHHAELTPDGWVVRAEKSTQP